MKDTIFIKRRWSNSLLKLGAVLVAFGMFFALGQGPSWATPEQNPHLQSAPPTQPPDNPPDTPPDTPPNTPPESPAPSNNSNDDDDNDDGGSGFAPPPEGPPPIEIFEAAPVPEATPTADILLPPTGRVSYLPTLLPLLLLCSGSGLIALGIWLNRRQK